MSLLQLLSNVTYLNSESYRDLVRELREHVFARRELPWKVEAEEAPPSEGQHNCVYSG